MGSMAILSGGAGKALLETFLKDVPLTQIPDGIKQGETKIIWDKNNADEVANAKRTFDDLKKKGFLAFSVRGDKDRIGDKGEQIFAFDASIERIIMSPPMRGGL